jgi:fatty-acyl-CoA synthase
VRDPKVDPPLSEEDIKAHVMSYCERGIISKYGVPQRILFVEALAKTSVGKLDKKALRQQYDDTT